MGIFTKILRGIDNIRVYGREYSKVLPYSISFEGTKIKWYKGRFSGTYISKDGKKDLFFFTDPELRERDGIESTALFTWMWEDFSYAPPKDDSAGKFMLWG